jgi:hypothetical protein
MRLYHHTNSPLAVLSETDHPDDDAELVLTRSSAHSREYDVLLRIDVPDAEVDRLTVRDKKTWVTTKTDLILAGAEIECASEEDRQRVAVYQLAVQRTSKLETIANLRRYVEQAADRPEASRFTMMLPTHQDHLADLENAIAEGSRKHGVRHLGMREDSKV